MKLFDATLDLARYARGVETHRIMDAQVNMRSLVLGTMTAVPREFNNGACWFLTGVSKGEVSPIQSAVDQRIILRDPMPKGYKIGDTVSISPWLDFTLNELENAVNNVLAHYPIMKKDDSIIANDGATYELPDGIYDVRRVELEGSDGKRRINQYWSLDGDALTIHYGLQAGARIVLHYVSDHGAIDKTGRIHDSVDSEYLRKMATLNLWRNEIQTRKKDNIVAVDMFNEAKNYEEMCRRNNVLTSRLMPRDRTFSW